MFVIRVGEISLLRDLIKTMEIRAREERREDTENPSTETEERQQLLTSGILKFLNSFWFVTSFSFQGLVRLIIDTSWALNTEGSGRPRRKCENKEYCGAPKKQGECGRLP